MEMSSEIIIKITKSLHICEKSSKKQCERLYYDEHRVPEQAFSCENANCNNTTVGLKNTFVPKIKFIKTYNDKIGEKNE